MPEGIWPEFSMDGANGTLEIERRECEILLAPIATFANFARYKNRV